MTPEEAKDKAIEILGGPVSAARAIGVRSYQTVQQWRRVPAVYAPVVERLTKSIRPDDFVTCEEMAPEADWAYLRAASEKEAA